MSEVHFLPPRPARPADFPSNDLPVERATLPASIAEMQNTVDLLTCKLRLLGELTDVIVSRLMVAGTPSTPKPKRRADLLHGMAAIAAYLSLGERQARYLADLKEIPTFKIKRIVCARRTDLNAWLDAHAAEVRS